MYALRLPEAKIPDAERNGAKLEELGAAAVEVGGEANGAWRTGSATTVRQWVDR